MTVVSWSSFCNLNICAKLGYAVSSFKNHLGILGVVKTAAEQNIASTGARAYINLTLKSPPNPPTQERNYSQDKKKKAR